uniref:Uncharacterized protein n=1 Tax=Ascaris lumbricoides TaxID=6252 RepID=A0A0M3HFG2_ASCLU
MVSSGDETTPRCSPADCSEEPRKALSEDVIRAGGVKVKGQFFGPCGRSALKDCVLVDLVMNQPFASFRQSYVTCI